SCCIASATRRTATRSRTTGTCGINARRGPFWTISRVWGRGASASCCAASARWPASGGPRWTRSPRCPASPARWPSALPRRCGSSARGTPAALARGRRIHVLKLAPLLPFHRQQVFVLVAQGGRYVLQILDEAAQAIGLQRGGVIGAFPRA